MACRYGNLDVVQFLLQQGFDMNIWDHVQFLLQQGFHMNRTAILEVLDFMTLV